MIIAFGRPITPDQRRWLTFDFGRDVDDGDTITGAQFAVVAVSIDGVAAVDPSPAARLQYGPFNGVPSPCAGPSPATAAPASAVAIMIAGCFVNNQYAVTCQIETALGEILSLTGLLTCSL